MAAVSGTAVPGPTLPTSERTTSIAMNSRLSWMLSGSRWIARSMGNGSEAPTQARTSGSAVAAMWSRPTSIARRYGSRGRSSGSAPRSSKTAEAWAAVVSSRTPGAPMMMPPRGRLLAESCPVERIWRTAASSEATPVRRAAAITGTCHLHGLVARELVARAGAAAAQPRVARTRVRFV